MCFFFGDSHSESRHSTVHIGTVTLLIYLSWAALALAVRHGEDETCYQYIILLNLFVFTLKVQEIGLIHLLIIFDSTYSSRDFYSFHKPVFLGSYCYKRWVPLYLLLEVSAWLWPVFRPLSRCSSPVFHRCFEVVTSPITSWDILLALIDLAQISLVDSLSPLSDTFRNGIDRILNNLRQSSG